MKLGVQFTEELLGPGKRPALTDEPDLEPGEWIELERFRLWIKPLKQNKKGIWSYSVRDHRPAHIRVNATAPLGGELSTIATGRTVTREPEPEPIGKVEHDRDRLDREVDAADCWRREQQRQREEQVRLEFGLARARRKGRKGSIIAIEERLKRVIGRVDEAA